MYFIEQILQARKQSNFQKMIFIACPMDFI